MLEGYVNDNMQGFTLTAITEIWTPMSQPAISRCDKKWFLPCDQSFLSGTDVQLDFFIMFASPVIASTLYEKQIYFNSASAYNGGLLQYNFSYAIIVFV